MYMDVEHAALVSWMRMREGGGHGNITKFVEECIKDPVVRERVMAAIRAWEKKFQAQTRT